LTLCTQSAGIWPVGAGIPSATTKSERSETKQPADNISALVARSGGLFSDLIPAPISEMKFWEGKEIPTKYGRREH